MSEDALRTHRQLGLWLLACCAVLFALTVLGGVTRLTGSGLSIVHWEPITGVLPPFDENQWQRVFEEYRESPEYQRINRGMSLAEFQVIFWFEYAHRLLARILGLVYALPLAWFWWRGQISADLRWPLLGLLALGAGQGYLGWYMVQSGLVDVPQVSQYRLAAHLGLALLIYAGMLTLALRLLWPGGGARAPATGAAGAMLVLIAITLLSGAFVAGLRAGFLYPTFPLMGGRLVPEGVWALEPAWRNLFENPVTVQLAHRLLGIATVAGALGLWLSLLRSPHERALRLAALVLALAALGQAGMGIATLLNHVPIALAAAHQGGALVLLSVALVMLHLCRSPRPIASAAGPATVHG